MSSTEVWDQLYAYIDPPRPLHEHLSAEKEETLIALIASSPGAAKERNARGDYPLHVALSFASTTKALVDALLDAFPGAAKEKSSKGNCPLHIALTAIILARDGRWTGIPSYRPWDHDAIVEQRDAQIVSLIDTVITAWPGALKEKDANGDYPLHLTSLKYRDLNPLVGLPEAVVAAVYSAWPGGIHATDSAGKTPLYYGDLLCVPDDVVRDCMGTLSPEACCSLYLRDGKRVVEDEFL